MVTLEKMVINMVKSWKRVLITNISWIVWYLIYLFIWKPSAIATNIECGLYGLSIIPFCLLVIIGVTGIYFLISHKQQDGFFSHHNEK